MAIRAVNLELPITGIQDGTAPGSPVSYARDVFPHRGMLISRRGLSEWNVFIEPTGYFQAESMGWSEKTGLIFGSSTGGVTYGNDSVYSISPVSLNFSSYIGQPTIQQWGGWIEADGELISAQGRPDPDIYASNAENGFLRWAGSTQPQTITGATIATTAPSATVDGKTVTSSAAVFTSAMVNMYITIPQYTTNSWVCRRIVSVISSTKILVDAPFHTTVTGKVAHINSLGVISNARANETIASKSGMFNVGNNNAVYASSTAFSGGVLNVLIPNGMASAYHQGRLFVANILETLYDGTSTTITDASNRIRWSGTRRDIATTASPNNGQGITYWDASAYVDVDDVGGIVGLGSFRGDLLVLGKSGIGIIRGAFATDGTDNGATYSTLDSSAGTFGPTSWCVGNDGVYWMNARGVYMWDGSQIAELSAQIGDSWSRRMSQITWGGYPSTSCFQLSDIGSRVVAVIPTFDASTTTGGYTAYHFIKGKGIFEASLGNGNDVTPLFTRPINVSAGSAQMALSVVSSYSYNPSGLMVQLVDWINDFNPDSTYSGDVGGNITDPMVATQSEFVGSPYRVRELGLDVGVYLDGYEYQTADVSVDVYSGNRGSYHIPDPYSSMKVGEGVVNIKSSGPEYNRINVSNVVPESVTVDFPSTPSGRTGSSRFLSVEISTSIHGSGIPGNVDVRFIGPVTAMLDVDDLMESK